MSWIVLQQLVLYSMSYGHNHMDLIIIYVERSMNNQILSIHENLEEVSTKHISTDNKMLSIKMYPQNIARKI